MVMDMNSVNLYIRGQFNFCQPCVLDKMNDIAEVQGMFLNITAVERETGLSKDVLRMWERRYGYPKPDRDANGERLASAGEAALSTVCKAK